MNKLQKDKKYHAIIIIAANILILEFNYYGFIVLDSFPAVGNTETKDAIDHWNTVLEASWEVNKVLEYRSIQEKILDFYADKPDYPIDG